MTRNDELANRRRGSLRLALRIARRDALAHLGRSALIIALIAIPIIGLSGLATVEASNVPTAHETIRDTLGGNQAQLTIVDTPDPTLEQDPQNPQAWETHASVGGGNQPSTQSVVSPAHYLPAGTRILTLRPLAVIATTATGIGSIDAIEGEPWNRSFAGRFEILSGHAPTNANQVMATPAALQRLGAAVGQNVTISSPRSGTFTVVGTMRDLTLPNSEQQLFAKPGALDGVTTSEDLRGTSFYLPDRVVTWPQVQRLNHDGITVLSRAVLLNPPAPDGIRLSSDGPLELIQSSLIVLLPVVAFSLFEVALLAGAAFMVGTKQQERALATLASVGGDRRMLARVVSSAGIVLGLAGGLVGSGLGIGLAWVYMQLTADGSIARYPGFHVDPFVFGGIVIFALIAGWIAALVPARRAARIDVVASLRGAARPAEASRKAPVVGVVLAFAGIAITASGAVLLFTATASRSHSLGLSEVTISLIVAGPIVLQIAALVITPSVLRVVARALSRFGTAARMASRDAARNASRSVPAVGAIMSTIFVASFLMTYTSAAEASQRADYEYRTAPGLLSANYVEFTPTSAQNRQLEASMRSTLGVSRIITLDEAVQPGRNPRPSELFTMPRLNSAIRCTDLPDDPKHPAGQSLSITSPDCQGPQYLTNWGSDHIWIASASAIASAIGVPLTSASRAALDAGKVVSFYPQYLRDGKVTIDWWPYKRIEEGASVIAGTPTRSISLPAVVQEPPHPVYFDMVMTPATARAAGIRYVPSQLIARVPQTPSDGEFDALNAAAAAVDGNNYPVAFNYEGGPPVFATLTQWALLALCAIVALGAASIAIGLARAEGRRDEAVLGSLGAPPRLRRTFSLWSAAVVTGVGSIGGVLLGTIPAIALSGPLLQQADQPPTAFGIPWLPLLVAAIGLPLLLAVGSWLTAGRARVQYNVRAPIE